MKKDPLVYVEHILDSIKAIEEYVRGSDKQKFLKQPLLQDGVVRRLEIIGEAARYLSDALMKQTNQVEWRAVKAMRNFFIHEYFHVDLNLVWKVVSEDLPVMKRVLKEFIKSGKK